MLRVVQFLASSSGLGSSSSSQLKRLKPLCRDSLSFLLISSSSARDTMVSPLLFSSKNNGKACFRSFRMTPVRCDSKSEPPIQLVVGCLVEHGNKILLVQRNIQPAKGLWTLPAGFMEIGESAVQGATRETWEEAGADVEVVSPFIHMDVPLIGHSYMIFRAKLKTPHFAPGPESLDCKLFAVEDIPFDTLAFSSMLVTLNLYIKDLKAGKPRFHYCIVNKRYFHCITFISSLVVVPIAYKTGALTLGFYFRLWVIFSNVWFLCNYKSLMNEVGLGKPILPLFNQFGLKSSSAVSFFQWFKPKWRRLKFGFIRAGAAPSDIHAHTVDNYFEC